MSIKKLVYDLPDRARGANYVVGGGIQDVPRGAIVHHEGVVTGGPQIIGTPYHGGVWVLECGFQHLRVLLDGGVPQLPNNPSLRGQQHYARLLPLQPCKGARSP